MDPLLATASAAASQEHDHAPPPTLSYTAPEIETKLYAIGDIHLSFKANREALEKLLPHPHDSLILCGDVGESAEHCHTAFARAKECFRQVWWVPGNHELYTMPAQKDGARGEGKYMECVDIARQYGVLTPEDDFVLWGGHLIAPIFTLYDYSFRPEHVTLEKALDWAREEDIEATDEHLLHPDPYASRIEWCHALVAKFAAKLAAANTQHPDTPVVIINHWPLRQDLVKLPRVPRFCLWCGTTKTQDWHNTFNASVVVSGHLHIRRTDWIDRVRFEEVSFGYPRQWQDCKDRGLDINDLLREILPGPEMPENGQKGTVWRQFG